MIWLIETTKGGHEGVDLESAIHNMAMYYAGSGEIKPNIEFIVGTDDEGNEKYLSDSEINKKSDEIDDLIEEYIQCAEQEMQHEKDLNFDYYASLL
jgi:hypothetical protein